jgi:hypothetical protein
MRVNRKFLYWGIFLVATGGVLVAADLTTFDAGAIGDALRLWPLAIIAIGLGLVLRRTRFAVAGGMLAAAVPGLVLGGAFALAPRISVACGPDAATAATTTTRTGTFDGTARVRVTTGCGALVVDTADGSGWQLVASNPSTRPATIDAGPAGLTIDAGGGHDWHLFDRGHDSWHLTVPTSPIADLTLAVNAGTGRIDLGGAHVDTLHLTTNAASATIDLSGASVAHLTAELNAGAQTLRLSGTSDVVGAFDVNAGSLEICTPPGLGLMVQHKGALSGIRINGRDMGGPAWESDDDATAAYHALLTITANLGSAEINPIGGCK